jgi:DNA ligase D-like protein (predicted ligase)
VRQIPASFVVFDLLYTMGHDLRAEPLERRKDLLRKVMRTGSRLRFSRHRLTKGTALFQTARQRGWEGIIGKRRSSPYREARSRDWVKIKTGSEQELVIGGWTEPKGSREYFGALLLGYYSGKGLQYAGHVGTGFDRRTLKLVMSKLRKIPSKRGPFVEVPPIVAAKAHWVRPRLVAQIKFAEWTHDDVLRQPVYIGLRTDKNPRDVRRERAARAR